MSWVDAISGRTVTAGRSGYDTSRFGLAVDRITVPVEAAAGGSDDALTAMLDAVAVSAADVIVLRYPADRIGWYATLTAATARTALLADGLIYWRLRVGNGNRRRHGGESGHGGGPEIGWAPPDMDSDSLVADIFAAYGNHYLADPLFDRAGALAGYQEWARRCVAGGDGLVLGAGGDPVGLATVADGPDHVEILLAGVSTAVRGRGWYSHLLAGVEDRAAERGLGAVVISTQTHNTGVQRAWTRYGFEPVHTLLTVHLVRPGLLPSSSAQAVGRPQRPCAPAAVRSFGVTAGA